MTGRVIEVRLSAPMPDFLRLLALSGLLFVSFVAGAADDAVQADTPLMLMRLRGRLQMRLQLNRPRRPASELAALDVFARLCQRTAQAEGARLDISSRG